MTLTPRPLTHPLRGQTGTKYKLGRLCTLVVQKGRSCQPLQTKKHFSRYVHCWVLCATAKKIKFKFRIQRYIVTAFKIIHRICVTKKNYSINLSFLPVTRLLAVERRSTSRVIQFRTVACISWCIISMLCYILEEHICIGVNEEKSQFL